MVTEIRVSKGSVEDSFELVSTSDLGSKAVQVPKAEARAFLKNCHKLRLPVVIRYNPGTLSLFTE